MLPDERLAIGFDIMQSSVYHVLRMAYPLLAPLHDLSTDWGKLDVNTGGVKLPPQLPLSA